MGTSPAVERHRKEHRRDDWNIEAIAEVLGSKALPLDNERLGNGSGIPFGQGRSLIIFPDAHLVTVDTGSTNIQFRGAKPPKISKRSVTFRVDEPTERRQLHVARNGAVTYNQEPVEQTDPLETLEGFVTVTGNIGAPPAYKILDTANLPILRFPLPSNDENGTRRVDTVLAFGGFATMLQGVLRVGQLVEVRGIRREEELIAHDGTRKKVVDLHASEIKITFKASRPF